MYCPVCETVELKLAERQGIEIDYCPKCRGVWLDRGELDKIIERSSGGDGRRLGGMVEDRPYIPQKQKRKNDYHHHEDRWHGDHMYHDDDDDYRRRDRYDDKRRKNRKKDFLEDLFDIFD